MSLPHPGDDDPDASAPIAKTVSAQDTLRADLEALRPWFHTLGPVPRGTVEMFLAGKGEFEIAKATRRRMRFSVHVCLVNARSRLRTDRATSAGADESISYPDDVERPMRRSDCIDTPRPCPFVSCTHHLFLDVSRDSTAITLSYPHLVVWEMKDSCSLDVADRQGLTLEEVGRITDRTRERVRQIETLGLNKIKEADKEGALGLPLDRQIYAGSRGAVASGGAMKATAAPSDEGRSGARCVFVLAQNGRAQRQGACSKAPPRPDLEPGDVTK